MGKHAKAGDGITRRSLVTGAAALSMAAAVSGLVGCSPKGGSAGEGTSGSSAGNVASGVPTNTGMAARNPQDEEFTAATTDFSALLQPLSIGGKKLRNRFVKSGAGSYTPDNGITQQTTGFYGGIAQGGAGLVIVEDCNWAYTGPEDVKAVVDAVHDGGALCGMQVWGMWSQSASSKSSISPLEVVPGMMPRVKMETIEEIKAFESDILGLVDMYAAAGVDLIELNASCDHAFNSFLSRFLNVEREDEYGPQSLENRARIVTDLISAIKAAHPEMAVQVLFNGVEENAEQLGDSGLCTTPEEAVELAKLFQAAGADSLQVRSTVFGNHAAGFLPDIMHVGSHGNTGLGGQMDFDTHMSGVVNGSHEGVAALLDVAALVKAAVGIPVGVVGDMDPRLAPDLCNSAIDDGKVDFLVLNRPLLADPELPNKLAEGRLADVRPCNKCVSCFQSVVGSWESIGYCRVNPAYIRAYTEAMPEGPEPAPASVVKKVMVVGAGPAGLEAATVAAQRGHSVTLCEEDESLGGMLAFAASVKGPHERINDYLSYLVGAAQQVGVEVVTGQRVDEAYIRDAAPDAVILATGGVHPDSAVSVSGNLPVLQLEEAAAQQLTGKICIIGGSLRATDFANMALNQGAKVELVHTGAEDDLASAQAVWPRAVMLSWLKSQGAVFHDEATDISVTDQGVTFSTPMGTTRTVACDTVVLAEDLAADDSLAKALDADFEVYRVGDCASPASIIEAVTAGNLTARAL